MENNKSFCFFKGELVECSSGRVQDCNVKRVNSCIKDSSSNFVSEKDGHTNEKDGHTNEKDGHTNEKDEHAGKMNGFCLVKGEMVSCSQGRIQDCNVKNANYCILEKDYESRNEKETSKNNKQSEDTKKEIQVNTVMNGFCLVKGEMVSCPSGRIQDCNVKNSNHCILEDKKENETDARNGFCLVKGEMVSCSSGRIQDCNIKQLHTCPKEK